MSVPKNELEKFRERIISARTDQDYSDLEADLRSIENNGWNSYEDFVRSLIVDCNDSIGIAAENWRNSQMYKLHASSYKPMSERQVRKRKRFWRHKGYPVG